MASLDPLIPPSNMGNIFPRWTNWLPIKVLICLGAVGTVLVLWVSLTWTPKELRVGYAPDQPIHFDHSLHAGQLGMDCRYCHTFVEESPHSNIPAAQVCWNCHGPGKVASNSEKLEPLRRAMDKDYENYDGKPIEWVQIHKVPDYAYFNHSVHVNRGVSCVECHGRVDEMEVVHHAKSLSMGFCLDCHRSPEDHIRPVDEVTNLAWTADDLDPDEFYASIAEKSGTDVDTLKKSDEEAGREFGQEVVGYHLKNLWNVHPSQDCSACHR